MPSTRSANPRSRRASLSVSENGLLRLAGAIWGPLRHPMRFTLFGYVGVVLVLALFETKLVYPIPAVAAGNWSPDFPVETVQFQSADGTDLHGWLLEAPTNTQRWLLYCHGNGSDVASVAPYLDSLRAELPANIFVFDYRGYGHSDGTPHEAGVLADSEAALHWICERSGGAPDDIILMGRSLGGGVAVHLAAHHGARAAILERTFTRLTDAAKANYWWAPIDWVMRNRYASIEKIPHYEGPLLCSHGTHDRIVPFEQGRLLFDAAGAPASEKHFVTLENLGHNDPGTEDYNIQLVEFLRRF